MRASIVFVIVLGLCMVGAIVYVLLHVPSPILLKNLREDADKRRELSSLSYVFQRYYQDKNHVPESMDELQNYKSSASSKFGLKVKTDFDYYKVNESFYKLCTTFGESFETASKYGYQWSGLPSYYKPHPQGYHCYEFDANVNNPTGINHVSQTSALSCVTQGGKMIKQFDGQGQIGCDVIVSGEIDLAKSYCQSVRQDIKIKLIPDQYKRPNWYYATLITPDLEDEVRVYVFSKTGERIECFPRLNDFYDKG